MQHAGGQISWISFVELHENSGFLCATLDLWGQTWIPKIRFGLPRREWRLRVRQRNPASDTRRSNQFHSRLREQRAKTRAEDRAARTARHCHQQELEEAALEVEVATSSENVNGKCLKLGVFGNTTLEARQVDGVTSFQDGLRTDRIQGVRRPHRGRAELLLHH